MKAFIISLIALAAITVVSIDDFEFEGANFRPAYASTDWRDESTDPLSHLGSPEDAASVVDPSCRFIGVDNLSVVDASVIPVIPRANTHLTAVMIAERAASFLIK